jgi:uncharacterized membrane protein YheB (UPF0754 family)
MTDLDSIPILSGALLHLQSQWIALASIPLFTGAIGWLINWSGVLMLFNPVNFHGFRMPGLRRIAPLLPHKAQEIPGVMTGRVGWQGIIPARAGKMGSIAVDKGIAKLGSPAEFYAQLEPEKIAEHIVATFRTEIRAVVDDIMRREQPGLWQSVPERVREAVFARVQQQLPGIVREVTDEIGRYIDQLLDVKLMVVEHLEKHPALVNRIFEDVGKKELNQMIMFGGIFGFLLGIPVAFLDHTFHLWWLLPILGVIVGWTTNLLGMSLIFEPVDVKKVGPFKLHGLFLRRQREVADVYAGIIAGDVVTLGRIGDHLLNGPAADRTRQMLETALEPAVDRAAGPARMAMRVAVGSSEYDTITQSVASEAVGYTMVPLLDEEFGRKQSERIKSLISARMKELPSKDFVEMLRAAIKEDEWMLYVHGAVMGFAGGAIHLLVFGVSHS